MNRKAYEKLAEGHRLIAEGYDALAAENKESAVEMTKKASRKKAVSKEEVSEKEPESPTEELSEYDRIFAEKETYTVEDLRAALHYVNGQGHLEDCQKIFAEFGAKKVSQLPEENYSAVMEKVRSIANA